MSRLLWGSSADPLVLELRSDASRPVLRGYAVIVNQPSAELIAGRFREQIAPEALDRTFRERIDVRAFANHDQGAPLARLSRGTLRLERTPRGLLVEIDPPDTTIGRDLVENVRRGDVTSMSFGMEPSVTADRWAFDRPDGIPLRTIIDTRIREVSPVSIPAYEGTDLALRSLEAAQAAHVADHRRAIAIALRQYMR